MRKALVVLLASLLVGAAVWYAATHFPPVSQGTADSVSVAVPSTPTPPLGAPCGHRCGVERWDVKTLSDADRGLVRLRAVDATVEQLTRLQPGDLAPGGARLAPAELTVYRVEGYLGAAAPENDGDWHLVIFDLRNQRVSLIAEIPDPSCGGACESGFAQQFAYARARLEARLARPNPKDLPILVRVTGVGFFDREHGQAGAAPNGFELHPVISLEFQN